MKLLGLGAVVPGSLMGLPYHMLLPWSYMLLGPTHHTEHLHRP